MTTPNRLALAALASAVFHALVMYGAWVPLPRQAGAPRPLQARLAPPPSELKPTVPKPKVRAPRRAAPSPVPAVPTMAAPSPLALPEFEPDDALEEADAVEPAVTEPPQQVAVAAESSVAEVRSLPRKGRITFTLVYGENGFNVGKAVHSWEVEAGAYVLANDAETTGIIDFFRPQRLRYLSRGRITEQGLKPESFLFSRTRRGRTEAALARFDWSAGHIVYGDARDGNRSALLPAGSQDLMSFIYHLALHPPAPGTMRLSITSGVRFESHEIEVHREENIETPIGMLRTLPVKQIARAGEESLEIWLAAEYRYLPVKIRYFDREGNPSGEQIVSDIRISEE